MVAMHVLCMCYAMLLLQGHNMTGVTRVTSVAYGCYVYAMYVLCYAMLCYAILGLGT